MKKFVLIVAALMTSFLFVGFAPVGQAEQAPQGVKLNILMYHHICKAAERQNKFTILPQDFESDVAELAARGYGFVLMEDLVNYVKFGAPLPEKPIMLTFDDGYLSFYKYAYPVLQKYGAKALLSVIGIWAEKYTAEPDPNVNYAHMTWPQIAEVERSPYVEIGNHTYDMHRQKGSRTGTKKKPNETVAAYRSTLSDDIGKLQTLFKEKCGFTPITFTYPFGFVSEEAGAVVKEMGFQATLTCWEGVNHITSNGECLLNLRRYNRPARIGFQAFMDKIEKVG